MTNRRMLKSNRFLPEYVTRFKDRHGKERLRFRRKGYPSHYFKAALGTEDFRIEYAACMDPEAPRKAAEQARLDRAIPGSLLDLFTRYVATPERLGPTKTTQDRVRSILERFVEGNEHRLVRDVRFDHLDAIIARTRKKTGTGNKQRGGIEAARKLRKELMRMFAFAVKLGIRADNPVEHTDRIKVAPSERTRGFHTWTEDEIARYRARHPLGTAARLAMELMLWTDQRKVDSIHLGRQHIQDGRFRITQSKTGKTLWIAIAPQLLEAIVAMPPNPTALTFLLTEHGRPYSTKGFGNRMRDWCDEAGLPLCTAHGLRKATMRRMAELDMGNQTMKSMSGHTNDDEVALYTREANQKRMADAAVAALSRWEVSNLDPRLDTKSA
ncbi:integrase [Sphingomonas sp. MA1305]|uniref:site-specific integrase n=1 Tax=Sphingomonas sp. MA1305 TaxID=2479204 RepID=UPI0018DF26E5|nr:tyrosine-type recombinase/integrase [Sphingomonas sp. MA1305]MBI0475020.1 integrase [Sphingomonas sp. MA1305]